MRLEWKVIPVGIICCPLVKRLILRSNYRINRLILRLIRRLLQMETIERRHRRDPIVIHIVVLHFFNSFCFLANKNFLCGVRFWCGIGNESSFR